MATTCRPDYEKLSVSGNNNLLGTNLYTHFYHGHENPNILTIDISESDNLKENNDKQTMRG